VVCGQPMQPQDPGKTPVCPTCAKQS
jgi:hypothetical protein